MSTPPNNPLTQLTDSQIWYSQLYIGLMCHRNKMLSPRKQKDVLCNLGKTLKVEADLRGIASPQPPYHVHDDPPFRASL